MGRERQKRKNRSGLSRVKQRTKSKKQVFNNAVIAAAWDKSQTLSQNYKRLGLAVKLNNQSGGVEKDIAEIAEYNGEGARQPAPVDSLKIRPSQQQSELGIEETQVERDPKTGRILRVITSATKIKPRPNPLNDPLNDLDSESETEHPSWAGLDNQHGNIIPNGSKPQPAKTDVVAQLEKRASMPAAKHKRRQTDNERDFIVELVQKHGFDYDQMARDMKINYMQRSAGDLKRRVKKWQESGGSIS